MHPQSRAPGGPEHQGLERGQPVHLCTCSTLLPQSIVPGVRMAGRSMEQEDQGPEHLKRAAQLLDPQGSPYSSESEGPPSPRPWQLAP